MKNSKPAPDDGRASNSKIGRFKLWLSADRKQKIITIGSAIIAVVGIAVIAILGWNNADPGNPPTKPPAILENITPAVTESPIPTIPIDPSQPAATEPPIELGHNVSVYINPVPDDFVIDRNADISPSHPEYIENTTGGGPYSSHEGVVYKNDRVISIDVFDYETADIVTFQFGVALGECNRFLYLNPVRLEGIDTQMQCAFRFKASKGFIIQAPKEYGSKEEMYAQCNSFATRRTVDLASPAEYTDPMHPGTVWFTQRLSRHGITSVLLVILYMV